MEYIKPQLAWTMTAQNSTATIKFFNAVDDDTDSDSVESTAAPYPKPHKNGYVLKPVVFMLTPLLLVQNSSVEQNPRPQLRIHYAILSEQIFLFPFIPYRMGNR